VDRVKYFRDRSARNRAREEKEILECEIVRTIRSFDVMQKAWFEIGTWKRKEGALAHSSYAFKQAELYARLASDGKVLEEKAKTKGQNYQQWYVSTYPVARVINFALHSGFSHWSQVY